MFKYFFYHLQDRHIELHIFCCLWLCLCQRHCQTSIIYQMQPNAKDLLTEIFFCCCQFLKKICLTCSARAGRTDKRSADIPSRTWNHNIDLDQSQLLAQYICLRLQYWFIWSTFLSIANIATIYLSQIFSNYVSSHPPFFYQGQKSCCLGQRHKQKRPQIFVASEMIGYFEANYWATIRGFIMYIQVARFD